MTIEKQEGDWLGVTALAVSFPSPFGLLSEDKDSSSRNHRFNHGGVVC